MAISGAYIPFSSLTDEELTAALNTIEAALVSFAEGSGQRTVSIGSVSFSYSRLDDLLRIRNLLIAAFNARAAKDGAKFSPYKVTILMR